MGGAPPNLDDALALLAARTDLPQFRVSKNRRAAHRDLFPPRADAPTLPDHAIRHGPSRHSATTPKDNRNGIPPWVISRVLAARVFGQDSSEVLETVISLPTRCSWSSVDRSC